MQTNDAFLDRIRELNASIQIRPALADDAKPFTELMNRQYRRKKTEDYFYWQFINFSNPTRLFVAYDKNLLVGCYGIQLHRLSNSALCGFAIDLLIREEYRNRALLVLFEETARQYAREKGAEAIASLPNYAGMRAHTLLKNWNHIGTVMTYTLEGAEIREKNVGPDRDNAEGEFIYFSKSTDYRKWRYEMNPEYEYDSIKLTTGEYAFTKIFKDPVTGRNYGDIVDFECSFHDRRKMRELFWEACNNLCSRKVEIITTWALPHTPVCAIVESLGFTQTPPERYFCFKALTPGKDEMYDYTRWHLVQADSEIY